jgi:type VI secretion system protein ImpF
MAEKISLFEKAGAVTPSLLDRLLDDKPRVKYEAPLKPEESRANLLSALRRDLENLLNTRSIPEGIQEELTEVKRSVYNYGLPDITAVSANYLHDPQSLARSIEEALGFFEPRLRSVSVAILPSAGPNRVLRLVIEGMLQIDPAPEHVVFDGSLELISGEYQIIGEKRAR